LHGLRRVGRIFKENITLLVEGIIVFTPRGTYFCAQMRAYTHTAKNMQTRKNEKERKKEREREREKKNTEWKKKEQDSSLIY